jgi:hypothetical protein
MLEVRNTYRHDDNFARLGKTEQQNTIAAGDERDRFQTASPGKDNYRVMVWQSFDLRHIAGRGRMGDFSMDPGDHHPGLSSYF